MNTYECPKCGTEIRHKRFTDDVIICPACGTRCRSEHDCYYDPESGDETCADYLEIIEEGE